MESQPFGGSVAAIACFNFLRDPGADPSIPCCWGIIIHQLRTCSSEPTRCFFHERVLGSPFYSSIITLWWWLANILSLNNHLLSNSYGEADCGDDFPNSVQAFLPIFPNFTRLSQSLSHHFPKTLWSTESLLIKQSPFSSLIYRTYKWRCSIVMLVYPMGFS